MRMRHVGVAEVTPEMKLLVTVDEAATLLSVGRSMVYDLLWRNEIYSVKVGRMRRIVTASLHDYIARVLGQDE